MPVRPSLILGFRPSVLIGCVSPLDARSIFGRHPAQAKRGDGLIGFSTSGNSANLIAAFAQAKEMGLVTIGFSGGNGGKMKTSGVCDHCLVVPTASIHRIQECHVTAYHILWDLVHTLLADSRGSASAKGAAA